MHFRKDVKRHQEKFKIRIHNNPGEEDIDRWYSLYKNVKNNSLDLNTFTLPRKLFADIANNPSWETLVLQVKDETNTEKTVGVVFSHVDGDNYIPMIIGLDYSFNGEFKVYRQALYQLVMRAGELRKKKVFLGFSAPVEKKKVGAVLNSTFAFMQIKDNFNAVTLDMMNASSATLNN